jgi:hypothetical protein
VLFPKLADCEKQAIDLIQRDYDEAEVEFGQRVGGVFHLGDAFVPGIEKGKIQATIQRLVDASLETMESPRRAISTECTSLTRRHCDQ